ncbi:MAG TPA: Trk family potassium uptake protein [Lachnospiraceae bacterium]|nr:Trk family potassium uptake protein [Lachnospiraceae bacterium]HCX41492.1 Trk family potassium uptake protein [Lachnospiraceae bacterium]
MSKHIGFQNKLSSFQIIILGFAGVIVLGALLLMLPISTQNGAVTPFSKTLFTATSAVCVTGLVVFDTASYWSGFGQLIILIMIQIGGLGVISVASFLSMLAGRKISLMQRQTMQNALSAPQMGGIVKLTRFIFLVSFAIEGIGALLLMPVFMTKYGIRGIWMAVFHSVSAFCNAGFDLMGNRTGQYSSLTSFAGSGYVTLVICLLIMIGGIGFLTWKDIAVKKTRFKEYSMQTKVILVTTAILIVIPAVFFFFSDFANEPLKDRICMSVFQAVTPRTAGFNTADLNKMSDAGRSVMMLLMLIGGSPGSTAGGMKTTTIAVLFANAIAVFRKRQNANCYGRRIDDSTVKNASAILFMYVFFSMLSAIIISITDGISMQMGMFETFSAIGTVGLTLGITPTLSAVSRFVLILLMFFGRVGGLTIIYAAFSQKDASTLKYPMENITVG